MRVKINWCRHNLDMIGWLGSIPSARTMPSWPKWKRQRTQNALSVGSSPIDGTIVCPCTPTGRGSTSRAYTVSVQPRPWAPGNQSARLVRVMNGLRLPPWPIRISVNTPGSQLGKVGFDSLMGYEIVLDFTYEL